MKLYITKLNKMIKEFTVNIDEAELTNIKSQIAHYPWPSIENMEGWSYGANKK